MDTLEQRLTNDLAAAAEAADLTVPDRAAIVAAADRRLHRRRLRTGLAAAVAVVVLAAAGSVVLTDDPDRTTISERTTTTSEPQPTTTAEPTTTSATTSTTTPTTTAPPPPAAPSGVDAVALRGDGMGAYTFGADGSDAATVVDAVSAVLGPPVSDVREPQPPGCGARGGSAIEWPIGFVVTWDGLSLGFGGPDESTVRLAGYDARSVDGTPLRMEGGPSLDDPLADWLTHYGGDMTVNPDAPAGWYDLSLPDAPAAVWVDTLPDGTEMLQVSAGAYCGGGD